MALTLSASTGPAAARLVLPRTDRLLLAGLGFLPITCLSASLFGVLPLGVLARWLVLPGIAAAVVLGLRDRALGQRALVGLIAGILATGVYDIARLSLVAAGLWHDFIPEIGRRLLDDPSASPLWGYLWRFLGNGGAMGLAYGVLPFSRVRHGVLFGTFVCCCLFGTLLLAPYAQSRLFVLTPMTAAGALVGHWIYGSVLGFLVSRWRPQSSRQLDM